MSRVAVIGSGIAGLSAAWLLSRRHEVWLYERENRLGGHTHTVNVTGERDPVPIDTGFIVHNEVNYPLLCRLFREIGIRTGPSDMSFSLDSRPRGLNWCSRGLNGLFTQRSNLLRPRFYALLREIARFNALAPALLERTGVESLTLDAWLHIERFSDDLRNHYLVPLAASVWSTPPSKMGAFPASTLVRFFHNHGFLGTQYAWRTIPGGCSQYIAPMVRGFHQRVVKGHPVKRVERNSTEVVVRAEGLEPKAFDEVIFAVHGDQVLPLLEKPTALEDALFRSFTTNANEAWLHRDTGVLPKRRRAWASWNHLRLSGADDRLCVTYHMNRLQPLATKTDWCVSLNPAGLVEESKVERRIAWEHPRFTVDSVRAQGKWGEVSGGRNRTHYCGAYWGYGFHEDGIRSAVRVAARMGVEW